MSELQYDILQGNIICHNNNTRLEILHSLFSLYYTATKFHKNLKFCVKTLPSIAFNYLNTFSCFFNCRETIIIVDMSTELDNKGQKMLPELYILLENLHTIFLWLLDTIMHGKDLEGF